MVSQFQRILHLYNRAGFGLSVNHFGDYKKLKLKKEQERFLTDAVKELPLTAFKENPFLRYRDDLSKPGSDKSQINKAFREEVKTGRKELRNLSVQWMQQLVMPEAMLREKMTFFWHDHFAVRSNNGYHAQLHNNLLRKNALGKYGDLLLAVAKDPAMLDFLNNKQNVKQKPNENFARELLELYTLGQRNYTEADIKNAAKAFTGWKYDRFTCEFQFVERQHDKTDKTFFGEQGSFDGTDIIEIVLANKQTARYLASKLFQYYVADEPDEEIIGAMAERLFKTEYDIGDLLSYIFKSDWFYEDRFVNNKIKSPIELLNGIRMHFGLTYTKPEALVYLQNSLDQKLFFPPSVNGWAVGREWIDSASLVNRMRLPGVLATNAELGTRVKEDLDNSNPAKGLGPKLLKTGTMNWAKYESALSGMELDKALDELSTFLINKELKTDTKRMLVRQAGKKENPLHTLAIAVAGLPEYQLA